MTGTRAINDFSFANNEDGNVVLAVARNHYPITIHCNRYFVLSSFFLSFFFFVPFFLNGNCPQQSLLHSFFFLNDSYTPVYKLNDTHTYPLQSLLYSFSFLFCKRLLQTCAFKDKHKASTVIHFFYSFFFYRRHVLCIIITLFHSSLFLKDLFTRESTHRSL